MTRTHALSERGRQGQTFLLFAILLPILVALLAVCVVDGPLYIRHRQALQANLDVACLAATLERGDIAQYDAFESSLLSNGVMTQFFQPNEYGADGWITRGIQYGPQNTLLAAIWGPHETYFLQFVGINSIGVRVWTRCRDAMAKGALPIAMREDWYIDSLANGTEYPILGQGVEATINPSGKDFRGAIVPQIFCADSDCIDMEIFLPLTTEPPADSVLKSVWMATAGGLYDAPYVAGQTFLPHLSGVSNKFLVQAMVDAGYIIGDHILLMIFDGRIYSGAGSWETVEIKFYALVEITEIGTNYINGVVVDGPIDSLGMYQSIILPDLLPWDWAGFEGGK